MLAGCADVPETDVPDADPVTRIQGPAGPLHVDDGGSHGQAGRIQPVAGRVS